MDFTFVCPSELIAFDKRYEEFQKRGVEVVGVSFDSEFVHNAWRNTPVDKGGIGAVKYAMVADIKREIQQAYGIEHPDAGVALRGSFLIDANGIVRHQVVNDLPLGRNIDEMLRMVDALQFHEEHGEVCPAQWEKGKEGMNASPDGVAKYLSENVSSCNRHGLRKRPAYAGLFYALRCVSRQMRQAMPASRITPAISTPHTRSVFILLSRSAAEVAVRRSWPPNATSA